MDRMPYRGPLVYPAQLLLLCSAYVALGKLGLALCPVSDWATLVWPPSGLSLAALLLGGYRLWPAVALGAFATSLWTGAPLLVALAFAAGNTLEAVAGTWALWRIQGFRASLDRFTDVVGLAVLGGMWSTTLGATIGTMSLQLAGLVPAIGFARTWLAWWTGDLMGVLIVAPVLLTWAQDSSAPPRPARLAEALALGGVLIASSLLVSFQHPETAAAIPILVPHVLFFPLIWAALRFGTRGAALGMLAVAMVTIAGTYTGYGVFARADQAAGLLALHVFLGAASVASLALGSVVSERERSQKAAREGEKARARLAQIVESSADAILGETREGTITSWNEAATHLYGYTWDEAIGRPSSMLVPPGHADELSDIFARLRRGERIGHLETVRRRKDGTEVEVALTLSPLVDASGVVGGASTIARDISERKRMEQELRQSEERHRLAVLAAGLGTWCWAPTRNELAWSPLCKQMYGVGADEEPSYARFLAMLHPEDRATTERVVTRSIAEHADYRIEHRVLRPDGSVHWMSSLGRPFYDAAGELDRMLGVTMDITPRKEAERERAELLEREQAARAEAQAASRAKDEFLAVLSHELRTPLQSMLGWAKMLNMPGIEPRTARKGLEAIERNVMVQVRLIEDLLDISRIVAGKLRLSQRPVELAQVVASAVESAKVAAGAKSPRFDVRLAAGGSVVLGDPDRLQQIVSNLLTNAVKFTPSSGTIHVRQEREGAAARIRVEDTGCGIPPEVLPHVFDRFRQADSSIRRAQGGLGLGLAIVRHLVELHGGTVAAESAGVGRGATFTVTLPLLVDEAATGSAEQKSSGPGRPEARSLGGVRVLVVDDEPDTCELLEAVVQAAGGEVRAVASAGAALEALEGFHPHLLVSDLGMPGEDGYALLRRVRAREAAGVRRVPVIALTAFASQMDRDSAFAAGFDAYLAKPVSPEDLASAVEELVKQAA